MPTKAKDEDWIFSSFSSKLPVPTMDRHGRRYSIDHGDLNLADFGAEQLAEEEEEEFPMRRQQVGCWLDRLPNTDVTAEGSMTSSSLSFDSSSEAYAGRSLSFNAVNLALAKRGCSVFKEVTGGPWELRRPSEVQQEARRRPSSLSSWGSDEHFKAEHHTSVDNIDWAVVDELKAFSWTAPYRGRGLTRPDFPSMSPKALGRRLWPELPNFSESSDLEDLFHTHATESPSIEHPIETEPIDSPCSEQPSDAEPVSEPEIQISYDSPKSRKWCSWFNFST
ncbi:MAG: hypothetical protein Q9184_001291 [Pyrenodesmia sp. 2 TL-2023]